MFHALNCSIYIAKTTTTVSLPAPSGLLSTSNIPSMLKPLAHRLPYKMWAIHHPTPVPLSSPIQSDWSSEEDWDGIKQKERERISKIIRKEKRKIAEQERKKEEESALLCRSCAPDLLNDEPNLPLTNPPAPAPGEKEKTQEKQRDLVTNYYPPGPIYVASYEEEDAPTLVNNLIPRPTSEENKHINKMEEWQTAESKRNRIEITDKEDELESNWDSDYSY